MRFEEVLPALKAGRKAIRKCWGLPDPKYGNLYLGIAKPEMRSHKYHGQDELLLWCNSPDSFQMRGVIAGYAVNDSQAGIIARDGAFYAVEWKTMSFEILGDDFEVLDET